MKLIEKARELSADCDCPHCKCLRDVIARLEAADAVCKIAAYPSWTPAEVATFRAWRDAQETR